MTTVNYFIPSINCGNCKRRIETNLSGMQGVQSVNVDVTAKKAVVAFNAPATEDTIKTFLARMNYPVREDPTNLPVGNRSCCG